MNGEARPTRRAVIAAGLALLAGACRPRHRGPRVAASTEPDLAAVDAAVAGERALIAMYDALTPAGTPSDDYRVVARALHAQHLQALGAKPAATPASSAAAGQPPSATARGFPRAESSSAARLRASAVAAESGTTAALLASIAASHTILSSTRQVGAG